MQSQRTTVDWRLAVGVIALVLFFAWSPKPPTPPDTEPDTPDTPQPFQVDTAKALLVMPEPGTPTAEQDRENSLLRTGLRKKYPTGEILKIVNDKIHEDENFPNQPDWVKQGRESVNGIALPALSAAGPGGYFVGSVAGLSPDEVSSKIEGCK